MNSRTLEKQYRGTSGGIENSIGHFLSALLYTVYNLYK